MSPQPQIWHCHTPAQCPRVWVCCWLTCPGSVQQAVDQPAPRPAKQRTGGVKRSKPEGWPRTLNTIPYMLPYELAVASGWLHVCTNLWIVSLTHIDMLSYSNLPHEHQSIGEQGKHVRYSPVFVRERTHLPTLLNDALHMVLTHIFTITISPAISPRTSDSEHPQGGKVLQPCEE